MFARKPSKETARLLQSTPIPRGPPCESPPVQSTSLASRLVNTPATAAPVKASPEEGLVTIGKGSLVQGKIGDCRKLVVHGILEADVVTDTLVVHEGGGIKGTVQTDHAEIHGVVEGTFIVHEHLEIESTGHITGDISYHTLAMKTGARLHGNIVFSEPGAEQDRAPEPTADIIPINDGHQSGTKGFALDLPTMPQSDASH